MFGCEILSNMEILMADIIMYQTRDGDTEIKVQFKEDNVWLTQAQMSELFHRDHPVISKYIKNILEEQELDEKAMCIFCTLQILTGSGILFTRCNNICRLQSQVNSCYTV